MTPVPIETLNKYAARVPQVEAPCDECGGCTTIEIAHGTVDCPLCTDQNGQPVLKGKHGRRLRDMTVLEQHAYVLMIVTVFGREVRELGSVG